MAEGKLKLRYDRIGDIFYVDKCSPYAEQDSDEIGNEIITRINPVSGAIENLEALFFSKRLMASESFELPVEVDLRLLS